MKLGWNQATCMKNSTLEQDLLLCEKYGFDYIEIRLDMLQEYLKDHTIDQLADFFKNNNLKPHAFNSIENINFRTNEQWDELMHLFEFACQSAKAVGAKYIIVVPAEDENIRKEKTWAEIKKDSVDALQKLADTASKYGIKLAYEPIGNPLWCVGSLDQALEIVELVNRDDVGLALDAVNLYMHNKLRDIDSIDKVPVDKLFVYHIDDAEDLSLEDLTQANRLFPGDGVISLHDITKKLDALGYKGICSVELFRPEYWAMNAEDVFKLASSKTKQFL